MTTEPCPHGGLQPPLRETIFSPNTIATAFPGGPREPGRLCRSPHLKPKPSLGFQSHASSPILGLRSDPFPSPVAPEHAVPQPPEGQLQRASCAPGSKCVQPGLGKPRCGGCRHSWLTKKQHELCSLYILHNARILHCPSVTHTARGPDVR